MTIIAILILGLVLRLVNLNQSLWLDETVQAITSKGSFLNLFGELRGYFHPPFYHFLMWGWAHLFGNGEIMMRLPSVFFGTATILIVYLIAKQSYSETRSLAIVAGLFLATAPFHIYYSQEARTYAMTTFFASLSMYWFVRMVNSQLLIADRKTPNIKHQSSNIFYIFSTAFMLYSDYYGLFVFLAQIVASLIILRKKTVSLLRYYVGVLLLFLPCLPLLWVQLKTGSQATAFLPEWGKLVNLNFLKALPLTFVKFSLGRITIFDKNLYALVGIILFLIYGGIILKAFRFLMLDIKKIKTKDIKQVGKNNDRNLLIILFCWLFIPVFLAWGVSFFIPNYQPFRLLLVLPAFYLLLSYGLFSFSTMILHSIIVGLVVGVNLVATGVYFFNPYFQREDWRGAIRYIESQEEKNSLALIPSQTSSWPYEYYSQGKVELIGVGKEIRPVTQDDLRKLSKDLSFFKDENNPKENFSIYYIDYLTDLFDPQNFITNWLESQKFVKIKEVSFNQIKIQRWKQKQIEK